MPRKTNRDISNLPVMKAKCKTCPFADSGCKEVRANVEGRLLDASQECHSSGWPKGKALCRGARDVQLTIFHRLGFIDAPTDAAWDVKRKELGA